MLQLSRGIDYIFIRFHPDAWEAPITYINKDGVNIVGESVALERRQIWTEIVGCGRMGKIRDKIRLEWFN